MGIWLQSCSCLSQLCPPPFQRGDSGPQTESKERLRGRVPLPLRGSGEKQARLAPPGTGEEEKGVRVWNSKKKDKKPHERKPRGLMLGPGRPRSRGTPCSPPREVHRPRREKKSVLNLKKPQTQNPQQQGRQTSRRISSKEPHPAGLAQAHRPLGERGARRELRLLEAGQEGGGCLPCPPGPGQVQAGSWHPEVPQTGWSRPSGWPCPPGRALRRRHRQALLISKKKMLIISERQTSEAGGLSPEPGSGPRASSRAASRPHHLVPSCGSPAPLSCFRVLSSFPA